MTSGHNHEKQTETSRDTKIDNLVKCKIIICLWG